jgi:hypothetical protein
MSVKVFKSLEDALLTPLLVENLDLHNQKLKAFPMDIYGHGPHFNEIKEFAIKNELPGNPAPTLTFLTLN